MSKPTYLHQSHYKSIVGDKIEEREESIIDGDKGLNFKLFYRKGDTKKKIKGHRDKASGRIELTIQDGDVKEKKKMDLDLAEFKKFVKSEKMLEFAVDYVSSLKGGKRVTRNSRKMSKKIIRKSRKSHKSRKTRKSHK